jgi:hypothetical protein
MPPDRVRSILTSESGTHFDEHCVDVCTADVIEHTIRRDPVVRRHVA